MDLCCGTGRFSINPSKLGFDVTGIDISPKSIEFANHLATFHNANCRFICDDLNNYLDCSNETFDIALIIGSLHYFDRNDFFDKLKRILNPHGVFICVEANGSCPFMNFRRKILNRRKTNFRDEVTMNGLLRLDEIVGLRKFFPRSELRFFDFSTLSGHFIPSFFYPKRLCENIDYFLLNKMKLSSLAWRYVFFGMLS